jgi:hypothetical protein
MAPKGKVKNASQKKSAAKPISGSVKKANKAPKFENGMDLGEWNRYATDKQKQRMNKRIEDGLKGYRPPVSAGGNTPGGGGDNQNTSPPKYSDDEVTAFQRSVAAILQQYGLNTPGMIGYLKGLLIEDKISDNPSEVELMGYLYDQPDFRARFPSIAAQADKQKNGWAGEVMSPRAVLEYEATLRNALASYGVDGYDVKTTASNLILGDVSANEAAMRVSLAAYAATTGPREVADALMQHEGIGPGDLVSFYLNPDKATKEIERKHATAQMQAWQRQQGLQQDWGFSEQVVAQGIQNDQAQAAFAQAAMQKNITSGYGETTTESDTKKAALGMSSQSEQSVRRSLSSRQGSFNKSGGAAESQTGVSGLRSSK